MRGNWQEIGTLDRNGPNSYKPWNMNKWLAQRGLPALEEEVILKLYKK